MIRMIPSLTSKRIIGVLRSETPWTMSLAVGGIAIQIYAACMLVRTSNSTLTRLPLLSHGLRDAS